MGGAYKNEVDIQRGGGPGGFSLWLGRSHDSHMTCDSSV